MMDRHLFLFGGSPPFTEELAAEFADLALKARGKVALLCLERDGWETYMPKYTCMLADQGMEEFIYLTLSEHKTKEITDELSTCTGVIICGGDTELYQKYIVGMSIGNQIRNLYVRGIPIAGFSAGALLSPEHCVIPPIDNSKQEHLFLQGLGLITDCVVSVHYSKWNERSNLITAMKKTNSQRGYGIDDDSGVYFKNEEALMIIGKVRIFNN